MKKIMQFLSIIAMMFVSAPAATAQTSEVFLNKETLQASINAMGSLVTENEELIKGYMQAMQSSPNDATKWLNTHTKSVNLKVDSAVLITPDGDSFKWVDLGRENLKVRVLPLKNGLELPLFAYVPGKGAKDARPYFIVGYKSAGEDPYAETWDAMQATAEEAGSNEEKALNTFVGIDGHTYGWIPGPNGTSVLMDWTTNRIVEGGQPVSPAVAPKSDPTTRTAKYSVEVAQSGDQELLEARSSYGQQGQSEQPGFPPRRPASESFTEVDCKTCPGGKQKMVWSNEANDWVPYGTTTKTIKRNQALLDANQDVALMERGREEHRMDDGRGLSVNPESEHMADPAVERYRSNSSGGGGQWGWFNGRWVTCPGQGYFMGANNCWVQGGGRNFGGNWSGGDQYRGNREYVNPNTVCR